MASIFLYDSICEQENYVLNATTIVQNVHCYKLLKVQSFARNH
jgi:hypothetical protein